MNFDLQKIRSDLKSLSIYEVILFGSYVEGGFGPNSDIDVALITRDRAVSLKEKNTNKLMDLIGRFPSPYEIHIYELLPIRIKYSIWSNYKVIFGDILEISEYFYEDRKVWDDCKHRILDNQFNSFKEEVELLKKHI
jgi:predicted nucleotidyltransferase